jgi:hypothetical protein
MKHWMSLVTTHGGHRAGMVLVAAANREDAIKTASEGIRERQAAGEIPGSGAERLLASLPAMAEAEQVVIDWSGDA